MDARTPVRAAAAPQRRVAARALDGAEVVGKVTGLVGVGTFVVLFFATIQKVVDGAKNDPDFFDFSMEAERRKLKRIRAEAKAKAEAEAAAGSDSE